MDMSVKNIVPILMIVAAVWASLGYLRPKYAVIQQLRSEKGEYELALENDDRARARRGHLIEARGAFPPEQWERLQKMLPPSAEGVQIARDISGIADIFDITLTGINFKEGESAEGQSAPTPFSGPEYVPQPTSESGFPAPAAPAFVSTPSLTSKILELSFGFETDYANFLRFLRELERSLGLIDVRTITIARAAAADIESEESGELVIPDQRYTFQLTVHTYWVE